MRTQAEIQAEIAARTAEIRALQVESVATRTAEGAGRESLPASARIVTGFEKSGDGVLLRISVNETQHMALVGFEEPKRNKEGKVVGGVSVNGEYFWNATDLVNALARLRNAGVVFRVTLHPQMDRFGLSTQAEFAYG